MEIVNGDPDAVDNTNTTTITNEFVTSKMSSVCWQMGVDRPSMFVTGSFDDQPSNAVTIWRMADDEPVETKRLRRVVSAPVAADVAKVTFIDPSHILAAHGSDVALFALQEQLNGEIHLTEQNVWRNIHCAECSTFSVENNELVTAGSDGAMCVIDLQQPNMNKPPIQCRYKTSSIFCCAHVAQSQVAVGTSSGHVQLLDVRADRDAFAFTIEVPESSGVTCVAPRPSQRHLIAIGTRTGRIAFVDVRNTKTLLADTVPLGDTTIWQMKFHPDYPENCFSCDDDGAVLHWDLSSFRDTNIGTTTNVTSMSTGLADWLTSANVLCDRLQLQNILPGQRFPVNCIDVTDNRLLAATESACLVLVQGLVMK